MRSVRLSFRDAQTLVDLIEAGTPSPAVLQILRLVAARIRAAMAPKKFVKAARKVKAAKKRTKKEETTEIRAAVMKRANYTCEQCGTGETNINPLTLDHMFGRKIPQTERNTWSLCLHCHRKKTNNDPSAVSWLMAFAQHAQLHSYTREQQMALKRLAFVEARSELSRGTA